MIAERAKRLVNVGEFANAGIPQRLSRLDLQCPYDHQMILRMALRVDGDAYHLPTELNWIYPMLVKANIRQSIMGIEHPFCYVTVRHGPVSTMTDDEWHVDGFSTKVPHVPEQNYVWVNSNATEYADLQVQVPDDFDPLRHNINHLLAQHITSENVRKCEDSVMYCMDPYMVHRRPVSTAGEMRTFVRISFVPIEINDIHNTQNPGLPLEYTADGVAHRNTLLTYPG